MLDCDTALAQQVRDERALYADIGRERNVCPGQKRVRVASHEVSRRPR